MNKKEVKKKFKIYEVLFFVIILSILVLIVLTSKNNNLKAHCRKAVCNEDNTICYNYHVNNNGKTVKTWEGNCSKIR